MSSCLTDVPGSIPCLGNRMRPILKVSVFGLGKLGACIAATFAARGFEVLGVDIDPEKVRKVNAGLPPVEEPLLADTIQAGRGRLRATQDHREAVQTDVSFFIPPSPSLPDGSFSNEFLLRAMQPIARAVREAGKLVLTVDYATTKANIDSAYTQSLAAGFVPYVSERALDEVRINASWEP